MKNIAYVALFFGLFGASTSSWAEIGASVDYSQVRGLNTAIQRAHGSYVVQVAPLYQTSYNLPTRLLDSVAILVSVENQSNVPFLINSTQLNVLDAQGQAVAHLAMQDLQQLYQQRQLTTDATQQALLQRDYQQALATYQQHGMQNRLLLPKETYQSVVYLQGKKHSAGWQVSLKTDEIMHQFRF